MKNVVLIDKSVFMQKYAWQKDTDIMDVIDNIVTSACEEYLKVNHLVCYLDKLEFEGLKGSLGKEFVIYSISKSVLPSELKPLCNRSIQYGGVYFMVSNN